MTAVVARRHVSFKPLIKPPMTTEMRRPTTSPGSLILKESTGGIQKYSAAIAESRVVTMPGQNPPNHALTMMAGNIVMRGSVTPHSGSRARRSEIPAAAAMTAIA